MLTYLEFASLGQLQGAMQGKVQLEDWRSERFDQVLNLEKTFYLMEMLDCTAGESFAWKRP